MDRYVVLFCSICVALLSSIVAYGATMDSEGYAGSSHELATSVAMVEPELYDESTGDYGSMVAEERGYLGDQLFSDVHSAHPYAAGIQFLYEQGVVDGNPDGSYAPERNVNRAELAKILVTAYGYEPGEEDAWQCFDDIDVSAWYAPYVCLAKELELVQGDGGAGITYRPGDTVNVAELLAVTSRMDEWVVEEGGPTWYAPLLTYANQAKLFQETWIPDSPASRALVADVISRSWVLYELGYDEFTGEELYDEYRYAFYFWSEEDCFEEEEYNPRTYSCDIVCESDEECEAKIQAVEEKLASLEEEWYGEGGDTPDLHDHYDEGGEDMPVLARYTINADALLRQDGVGGEHSYAEEQFNTMWEVFTNLVPSKRREVFSTFEVFTDGYGNIMGAVMPEPENPEKWVLQMDPEDAFIDGETIDWKELQYTLIHEYAHVLTLQHTEVDPYVSYEACTTYHPGEGCAKEGSYLYAFYTKYWAGIKEEQVAAEGDEEAMTAFYETYQDQFVTDYAATNEAEDMAESFTAFVIQDKPEAPGSIAEEKIAFFYDYPELVTLRGFMRKAIVTE